MWFFNISNNHLTTLLLLLFTFLLLTKMSTTNTTTTNTTTIIRKTSNEVETAEAASSSSLDRSKNSNVKWKERQQQQQRGLENFYKYMDTPLDTDFDVRLRGTLPLHRDNFLASLVGGANPTYHSSHNRSSNTDKIIRHTQYYNSLSPVDYNSIDMPNIPTILTTTSSTTTTTDSSKGGVSPTYPPPVFDFGVPRNITARAGQTASITCRVENLGDKSVSWIRKRDLHILTAGILTYTSDERFKVLRTADSRSWSLQVKYAQPRDSGIYECQVNTEPKISMAFRLNVIVTPPDAKAIIIGPTDLYVKVGSAITLTCHVKQPSSAHDIGPIYWYRGPYILTPFVAHPNDAAIDLQRISMESKLVEQLQSRLRIANAQTIDSGNYTCMPTTAEAASVTVNVINDESPAAMQKSSSTTTRITGKKVQWYLLNIIVCACNYLYYYYYCCYYGQCHHRPAMTWSTTSLS